MQYADAIEAMRAAAEAAGQLLRNRFRRVNTLTVSHKGRGDFVSEADFESEALIVHVLRGRFPDFGFLTEEGGHTPGSDRERLWIVDPLDGTTNFLHGIPYFGVTIALAEHDRIVAGATLDPLRGEFFSASLGNGAFLNGERLWTSQTANLADCLVTTGTPMLDRPRPDFVPKLTHLLSVVGGLRSMGAAALDLAYVAAGRSDAYWEDGQALWDVAAGCLLVSEAGGCGTQIEHDNFTGPRNVLAANPAIHAALLPVVLR
jgi:myo-inositol-1(or 4)-monophosphatase